MESTCKKIDKSISISSQLAVPMYSIFNWFKKLTHTLALTTTFRILLAEVYSHKPSVCSYTIQPNLFHKVNSLRSTAY